MYALVFTALTDAMCRKAFPESVTLGKIFLNQARFIRFSRQQTLLTAVSRRARPGAVEPQANKAREPSFNGLSQSAKARKDRTMNTSVRNQNNVGTPEVADRCAACPRPIGVGSRSIGVVLVAVLILGALGCTHAPQVVNLPDFDVGITDGHGEFSVLLVSDDQDPESKKWNKAVYNGLKEHNAVSDVFTTLPTSGRVRGTLYEVHLASRPKYSSSLWNLPITWPGYVIFTPAWNGMVYYADPQANVSVGEVGQEPDDLTAETVHANLSIRYTDSDRGALAESQWAFGLIFGWVVGAPAGIYNSCVFDDDVLNALHQISDKTVGLYIAEQIVQKVRAKHESVVAARRIDRQAPKLAAGKRR